MPRVSIKDIARAADVSHSTVSRALSDSPLVSAETKARVQHLAREMGYSPDAQARSLVMGRTLTIGVVVTTITDPFIAEIVQAIESTAHEVREKTREALEIMKPGGGYIAGASHDTILEETPLENVLAMFETIREYGIYN